MNEHLTDTKWLSKPGYQNELKNTGRSQVHNRRQSRQMSTNSKTNVTEVNNSRNMIKF